MPIAFRPSTSQLFLINILLFLVCASFGIETIKFYEARNFHGTIIFCVATLVMAYVTFNITAKALSSEPFLVINNEGITDNSLFPSAGFISWADISGVRCDNRFLNVMLKEPQKFVSNRSVLAKIGLYSNQFVVGTPISIGLGLLPIKPHELFEKIQGYRQCS